MIGVIARIRVLDGKADEFIAAAKEQIAGVKQHEAGKTLQYTLHRSPTEPNLLVFFETYADADALAAHGTTDHMKAFGGKLRGLLDGRIEVERLDVIAGLDG